nr:immunoglobulin light chain junction region [Macaca mulatta]
CQQENSVPWTF